MLDCYRELTEDWLAIPVIKGRKTESEKFPGARYTVSIEAMMADGMGAAIGHVASPRQNFTRAYGIAYSDRENQRQHPFQTSWGLSARTVGAVIMAHGDDMGLILPPKVAPIQVIVVPITRSNDEAGAAVVDEAVARLERECPAGVRLRVDRREGLRPGEKYAHWELRGVPLRVVVGAKDLADRQRHPGAPRRRHAGDPLPLAGLAEQLPTLLDAAQHAIYERAQQAPRGAQRRRGDPRGPRCGVCRTPGLRDGADLQHDRLRDRRQGCCACADGPRAPCRPAGRRRAVHRVQPAGRVQRAPRPLLLTRRSLRLTPALFRVDGDPLEVLPERVDRRGVQVAPPSGRERLRDAPAGQWDDHEPAVGDVLFHDGAGHGGEAEAGEQCRVERALLELEGVLGIDVGAERVRGERLGRAPTLVGQMAVLDQVTHGCAT